MDSSVPDDTGDNSDSYSDTSEICVPTSWSKRAQDVSVMPDLRTDSDSCSNVDSDSNSENSDEQGFYYLDMPTLSFESGSADSDSSDSGAFDRFCQNLRSTNNLQITEDNFESHNHHVERATIDNERHGSRGHVMFDNGNDTPEAESIQTSSVEPEDISTNTAIYDFAG